ncbi:peptidase S8/S53 domain-containing protein [Rhizoctonia solani]|nr:peptidase S8/S53 domain-containing protein [Rhizoctonia solani]
MMKLTNACVIVTAARFVTAAIGLGSIRHPLTMEVSYIVELSRDTHLKRGFSSSHEELYYNLDRRGATWEVVKEYSDPLLTGAAAKLGSDADLLALAQATGVQSITPVRLHSSPRPDGYSPHVMTGVDKLHAGGYFGKGIKIGIIDSGIDYTHPALGSKFGPGNKIIGGYDFVGDNLTNGAAPDPDPLDQCNGHGTHVAGIIGANPGNPWNISGVAYEAEINAYRVFSCSGSPSDDIILDAMLRAHNDGNDIFTLSLASTHAGWTEGVLGVVASRIAREGRIVTISAGNGGSIGSWYPPDPSAGVDVIWKAPWTSARLVIIPLNACDIFTQLANANTKGARYFVFYDDTDETPPAMDVGQYEVVLISKEDGAFLVEQAIPQNLTLEFQESAHSGLDKHGGLMSDFISYGPTYDMYLKPALCAPGGAIASTWPVFLGSNMLASGTSMSCPFVAGASALLLQARGKTADTARAARSIFQNTATPVRQSSANNSLITTAIHQGAGLINVYDAVKNTGIMLSSEILLNDTAYFKESNLLPDLSPPSNDAASVTITPWTITVPAGQSASIVATFKPPTSDSTKSPAYSGYIIAAGSDNSVLRSTYFGVAARLRDMRVVDDESAFFGAKILAILDKNSNPVPSGGIESFTMVGDDTPLIVYRLVAGSPSLHIDLLDSKTNITSVKALGVLYQERYPHRDVAIQVGPDWTGFKWFEILMFTNGTAVPNGSYKVCIRALKITGDPRVEDDYEVYYASSTVVINRA